MCISSICKHTRADVVLIVDEDDGEFTGLQQVSDEDLEVIKGNFCSSIEDWNFGGFTGAGYSTTDCATGSWHIEKQLVIIRQMIHHQMIQITTVAIQIAEQVFQK